MCHFGGILGDRFGNPLNSEYPVILAYNGTHYESLIPLTDHDERMSRIIIQKYIKDEDLFDDNNNEASSVNTIQSKQILIQRSEPIINHKEDDAILNEKNDARIGVDRWSRYHPTNTNSKNAINSSGKESKYRGQGISSQRRPPSFAMQSQKLLFISGNESKILVSYL